MVEHSRTPPWFAQTVFGGHSGITPSALQDLLQYPPGGVVKHV
jgi:hypothetical protein